MLTKIKVAPSTHHFLKTLPIFNGLKDDVLMNISQYSQVRHEKKRAVIFSPDSVNDKFYILVKGWVKIFRETMSGEEAIIDILNDGNAFGEIALQGTETIPYGAEAIEESDIIAIPRFLLAEELVRNSLFGLSVLQSMTRKKISSDHEIEHRTVQTAPQRIGRFLLKFCKNADQTVVTLNLPYDKNIIAGRLGMKPETFSRALAKLKEETGLVIRGASIDIPDIGKLAAYTCHACSHTFPCKEK